MFQSGQAYGRFSGKVFYKFLSFPTDLLTLLKINLIKILGIRGLFTRTTMARKIHRKHACKSGHGRDLDEDDSSNFGLRR